MRELHAWRGERRHAPDAPADTLVAAACDSPEQKILRDPAIRIAAHLEYRRVVAEAEARYAAEQREEPERHEQNQRMPERLRVPAKEASQAIVNARIFRPRYLRRRRRPAGQA